MGSWINKFNEGDYVVFHRCEHPSEPTNLNVGIIKAVNKIDGEIRYVVTYFNPDFVKSEYRWPDDLGKLKVDLAIYPVAAHCLNTILIEESALKVRALDRYCNTIDVEGP